MYTTMQSIEVCVCVDKKGEKKKAGTTSLKQKEKEQEPCSNCDTCKKGAIYT